MAQLAAGDIVQIVPEGEIKPFGDVRSTGPNMSLQKKTIHTQRETD